MCNYHTNALTNSGKCCVFNDVIASIYTQIHHFGWGEQNIANIISFIWNCAYSNFFSSVSLSVCMYICMLCDKCNSITQGAELISETPNDYAARPPSFRAYAVYKFNKITFNKMLCNCIVPKIRNILNLADFVCSSIS